MNTADLYDKIRHLLPDALSEKFRAGTSAQMKIVFKNLQRIDFNWMTHIFYIFVKEFIKIDKEYYNCNDILKLIKVFRKSYIGNEHNYRFWTDNAIVEFYIDYIKSRYDLSTITDDISDEAKLIEFLKKNENFAIIKKPNNTYVFKLDNNLFKAYNEKKQ